MKKTKNLLTITFWSNLTVALVIVALFETDILPAGFAAGINNSAEMVVTMLMELLTLALIPLSLKLFKLKPVSQALVNRKEQALLSWGTLRLCLLFGLLLANTLLYYIYMSTAFGYMALIVVLCLPFVYPSMDRCLTETERENAGNGDMKDNNKGEGRA